MKKIGICGHFNTGFEAIGGQTIKTRIISEALEEIYGVEQVLQLDTEDYKRSKVKFFFKCIKMAINSKNIIILPAKNGVKVMMPLFVLFSKIFGKKLHYIVVGAWLPDLLESRRYLIRPIKNIDYIYLQTNTLINKLSKLDINLNTYWMPNFKRNQLVNVDLNSTKHEKPYRLCMVSRINYKKGIESAIHNVTKLNNQHNENIVKLDIYGPIEETYKERFFQLLNEYGDHITYKGIIDYNNTVEIIKEYFLLLFPTKYYTEGFPGTVLDAYLSGVPVLASRWESWQDIIIEGVTGYTFRFNDDDDFYNKLLYLIENQDIIIKMKKNCIAEAKKYKQEKSIQVLIDNII